MKRTIALLLVLVTGLLLNPASYATNPASTTNLKADTGDIAHLDYGLHVQHDWRIFDGDYLECTFYKRDGQPADQTVTLNRKITVQYYYCIEWHGYFYNKTRWEEFHINPGQSESKRDIYIPMEYPAIYSDFFTNPQEYKIQYKP